MLNNFYTFSHETLGMHFWTLPSLVLGITMLATAFGHSHKQKKREKKFEEELEEKLHPEGEGAKA